MRIHLTPDSPRDSIVGVVAEVGYYRECLVRVLKSERDLTVIDLGSGGPRSEKQLAQCFPDVVVVDLRPAYLTPFVRRVHRQHKRLLIIALGVREDEGELVILFESGMAGFVQAGSSLDDVLASIRATLRGELPCAPRLAAALARRLGEPRRGSRDLKSALLTRREEEVLRFIADGLTNKEIAMRLSLEASTVKNHVHSILRKLSIGKRSDILSVRDHRPPVLRVTSGQRDREDECR